MSKNNQQAKEMYKLRREYHSRKPSMNESEHDSTQACIVWMFKTLNSISSMWVQTSCTLVQCLTPLLSHKTRSSKNCLHLSLVSCLQCELRISHSSFAPHGQRIVMISLEAVLMILFFLEGEKNQLQLCFSLSEVRLQKRRSSISSRRLRCWRRTASTPTPARWAALSTSTPLSQCAFFMQIDLFL